MPLEQNDQGLQIQQLAEIQQEYRSAITEKFGAGTLVNEKSNLGKWLGIASERESVIQEAIEAVYQSSYLSTAGGVSLDRVFEIAGITRQGATESTVPTMYATGAPSTVITAEALKISVLQTGAIFQNTSTFSLGTIGDETATSVSRSGTTVTVTISGGHSYPAASWVFIEGADQDEYNVLTEISNVTATTFDYEISGVLPVSPATGTILVKEATNFSAIAVETGATVALQGSLSVIETAITGLDRVENADDAVVGNSTETDAEARSRYESSLAQLGGATIDAITAKLEDVAGVGTGNAVVFQNVTDVTDIDNRPPHSIEAFVTGGADQDIFDALLAVVAAGIKQYGTETGTSTDSSGNSQPCAFSRLTDVRIYVDIVVITNSDVAQGPVFPASGQADIIDNITSIEFQAGWDVTKARIENAVTSVDGVTSVVVNFAKTSSPATDTTVVITSTEIADIDSGDITGTIDGGAI